MQLPLPQELKGVYNNLGEKVRLRFSVCVVTSFTSFIYSLFFVKQGAAGVLTVNSSRDTSTIPYGSVQVRPSALPPFPHHLVNHLGRRESTLSADQATVERVPVVLPEGQTEASSPSSHARWLLAGRGFAANRRHGAVSHCRTQARPHGCLHTLSAERKPPYIPCGGAPSPYRASRKTGL